MPLDSLLELVEILKQRIIEHGTKLGENEALTRYALIDPFLRELGWDTADPNLVIPEYKTGDIEYGTGNSRADYALRSDESAVIIVEAKRLGTPLQPVLSKVLNYCQMEGVDHLAVTDGRHWEVFETHKKGNIHEKRIVIIDLVEDLPSEVCRKAFALWRPNAEEGSLLPGQPAIVPMLAEPASFYSSDPSPEAIEVQAIPQQPSDSYDWKPISTLGSVTNKPPPAEMLLPDGLAVQMRSWKSIMIEVFRWLLTTNELKDKDIPLKLTKGSRYQLAETPFHSDGKPMKSYSKLNKYFLETHLSAQDILRRTILAIRHAGQDPTAFKVRFS